MKEKSPQSSFFIGGYSKSFLNLKRWMKKPRIVCGIMSGTSVDAIDVAIAEFCSTANDGFSFQFLAGGMVEFRSEARKLIFEAMNNPLPVKDFADLSILISHEYYRVVKYICEKASFPLKNIELIGMHGQTIWHQPELHNCSGYEIGTTLQAGSPAVLSALLGKTVIGDFRTADIACGGQGAPLVPVFDYYFLQKSDRNVIALNIGGISNITLLPANCTKEQVIAFDTGPGNVLIDYYAKKFFDVDYDKNGEIASCGKVCIKLLDKLKMTDYIIKAPPKSTGRELFNNQLIDKLLTSLSIQVSGEDLIRTLTEFTAWSIAENIRLFSDNNGTLVASGGGIHNNTLMNLLKSELKHFKIVKSDEIGINSSLKEAIAFAFLAYLTASGLPGNLPSVTGANRETVLGGIFFS